MKKINLFIFVVILNGIAGCGYLSMTFSHLKENVLNTFSQTQKSEKIVSPKDCFLVAGNIYGNDLKEIPVVVVAVSNKYQRGEIVSTQSLPKAGLYTLYLPEGNYLLLIFADINNNFLFEPDELVGSYNRMQEFPVVAISAVNGIITEVNIEASFSNPSKYDLVYNLKVPEFKVQSQDAHPSGIVVTLDDEIFSQKNGRLGLYHPSLFLQKITYCLYRVEKYDESKIPILFVHGAGGTPRDWKYLAEGIDRTRFQAWFFYYPSGVSIEKVAEGLYKIIDYDKNKFNNLIIVAHSMGGLVVRDAINRYMADRRADYLKLFISISTPFGGNDLAGLGLANLPIVVESWKDIDSESLFIKYLFRRQMPPSAEYYLFFGFRNMKPIKLGYNGDECLSIKSMLDPRAQNEATKVFGFDETHTSILNSQPVLFQLKKILSKINIMEKNKNGMVDVM
ncbi:MAG: alpha/beta hydrolase [Desulfobulbaceae bacterium]|nr:alpha/beta hydrolase [Desulfobulbaceae bacterium]